MAKENDALPAARKLCFVIGPIGKDGEDIRKHSDLLLHSVIRQVLEAEPFDYHVKRADEDSDPGMIGDRVITDIIRAELVVADLTSLNPNAFYELGIRHASEKPTIHIARAGTALPFDNIAHRTIFVDLLDWHSTEKARQSLAEMAKYIAQPGFKVSNPITQANASFKMRESADPKDKVLAALREDVARIEREMKAMRLRSGVPGQATGSYESVKSYISALEKDLSDSPPSNMDELRAVLTARIPNEFVTDFFAEETRHGFRVTLDGRNGVRWGVDFDRQE